MKNTKRILAIALTIVTLVAVMAVSADGSTIDTTPTVPIIGNIFMNGPTRTKDNTSRIYYQGLECADSHTFVRALGSTSMDGVKTNWTVADGVNVDRVLCRQHVQYSISSEIAEKGCSYATLSFRRLVAVNSSITLKYVWSPDSSGSYIPAT